MMRKKSRRKRRRQGKGKGLADSQIFSEFSEVYVCVCARVNKIRRANPLGNFHFLPGDVAAFAAISQSTVRPIIASIISYSRMLHATACCSMQQFLERRRPSPLYDAVAGCGTRFTIRHFNC